MAIISNRSAYISLYMLGLSALLDYMKYATITLFLPRTSINPLCRLFFGSISAYPTATFDLRGWGKSTAPREENRSAYSISAMASDIASILRQLNASAHTTGSPPTPQRRNTWMFPANTPIGALKGRLFLK
ncbi:hypothetical protein P175DRAFT_0531576 [Aspergillus ochraceoroseus IBT 24754]|uniref:Uncharacterized protein n=1 Tax=Aspergillus ochraceoroseus IBT 24754 TaxID=1392256 RepID=A0A2T5M0H2_9EURO|nr:uncharacterized protein P175DRAFT_0531576 [Aspergillus ochraceoroseus IBT 24754]PTU22030.1 hypothetical protein P175DRAFT_0531576 [Aspergillus ochraceoroseus IBT 24754]